MEDHILIRYGELSLKKTNRKQFIQKINQHIKRALKEYPDLTFEARGLRFYIHLHQTNPMLLIDVLQKIPGIHSFSIVSKAPSDVTAICEVATSILLQERTNPNQTIKVETNRGDKAFPLSSPEITKAVSRYLFQHIPSLKADMRHPDITLYIDVRFEGTFLFTNHYEGLGGFPAGCLGKAMLMVSGGIDSIVAGWMAIKKGITIEAVHFASPPYTSDLAVQKVVDLLEKLTPYTEYQSINLYIVPFTEIQQAIYQHCREDYGITIMRRMMYRITEILAEQKGALALLNGENIGQVASQTLESMATIGEVVHTTVIRPLSTMDKQEIVAIAQQIDTFDISIRPYEDCCTVFVPKHPQIKPSANIAFHEEERFDYRTMMQTAVQETKRLVLKKERHHHIFANQQDLEQIL